MSPLDRDQVREVRRVLEVDVGGGHIPSESGGGRVGAHAQHPADSARGNHVPRLPDDRASTKLEADCGVDAGRMRRRRHLLRFRHAASERPLAVDVQSGVDGCHYEVTVVRHAGCHRDQVDAARPDQLHATGIPCGHAER